MGKRAYSPQEIQDQNHPKKLITYLDRERKNNFWSDEEEQKYTTIISSNLIFLYNRLIELHAVHKNNWVLNRHKYSYIII